MKILLSVICLILLTSCGPSQEELRQAEMEQQRLEKEASEKLAQETSRRIAAVTCAVMQETRNMDAAVRVEKINEGREKIGGEPFLSGDDAIKEAFEFGLCQELVLNENYNESLQELKDAIRERERIAAEKRAEEARIAAEKRAEEARIAAEKRAEEQRIADSKPIVKEEFYSSGQLRNRTTYHSKNDGGVYSGRHGLYELFHGNGQLWERGYFKDGKLDGLWESFYENGQLWERGYFKDGEYDGLWEYYYENGQLKEKTNYKNGSLDGLWEYYYENGQVNYKVNYKDDERDGLWEHYEENGKMLVSSCYKEGIFVNSSYCKD